MKRQKLEEMMGYASKIDHHYYESLEQISNPTINKHDLCTNNPITKMVETYRLYFEDEEILGFKELINFEVDMTSLDLKLIGIKQEYLNKGMASQLPVNDFTDAYSELMSKYIFTLSIVRNNIGRKMKELLAEDYSSTN